MPYGEYEGPRFWKLGRLIAMGKFLRFIRSRRMIFSIPFTMKYPPSSSDSSFLCTRRAGELFSRWHLLDCCGVRSRKTSARIFGGYLPSP